MKLIIQLFIFLLATSLFSQNKEFEIHKNGLIYDIPTIKKLSYIVDSLNLKYKTCAEFPEFYSVPQGQGHFISLSSTYSELAIKAIKENISFDEFVVKFPYSEVKKDLLVSKDKYTAYDGQKVLSVREMPIGKRYGASIEYQNADLPHSNKWNGPWIYKLDSEGDIDIFYIPDGLQKEKLSYQYSHMIGYADCLIDTSSVKIKEDAKSGYFEAPDNWKSQSMSKMEGMLENMRNQRIIGTCSMDQSPRRHAMYIALLAAETTNWGVFLKAHLDIMNDRFTRVSDGSYAWAQRQTYLKELEVLDINVLDLIIGISLAVDNPVKNHYTGNIGRIGRALADAKNVEQFEQQLISMITDNQLDNYNRVLFYYMFANYIHHLDDEVLKVRKKMKLVATLGTLPPYIVKKIIEGQY